MIMIGTKFDLLQQKFGFFERKEKTKEKMRELNEELERIIFQNNVSLRFHRFIHQNNLSSPPTNNPNATSTNEQQIFLFMTLSQREQDLKKSGVFKLRKLLAESYDNTQHSVQCNFKHNLLFQLIHSLSSPSSSLINKKENKKDKKKVEKNSLEKSFLEGKKPFLQVSELRERLEEIAEGKKEEKKVKKKEEEERKEAKEALEELEKLLVQLCKLGVIVYFEHPLLRNTIIVDPRYFNLIFKSIIDYGRKRAQRYSLLLLPPLLPPFSSFTFPIFGC